MFQRLNLIAPERKMSPDPPPPSAQELLAAISVDPAKVEEVQRRTKQMLESGAAPEVLFLGQTGNSSLMFQHGPGKKPAMLLFTTQYAAQDYIRTTGAGTHVGLFKVDALPELARHWNSLGCDSFILNRCPRCTLCLVGSTDIFSSKEHFRACWAADRATRSVQGEILVRSAMQHMKEKQLAQVRANLEHIRDHLDCGIPYVHQMIGLIAGVHQDAAAKAAAVERLKEFGPQFDGKTDMSPEAFASATVGLLLNFGILAQGTGSGSTTPATGS
jgi:hypothetical protein